MSYVFEEIDEPTWSKVKLDLKENWRTLVNRRFWDEVAIGGGIAINQANGNYLVSAPVFIRDRSSSWYFFFFDEAMYCFRAYDPTEPVIEFYQGEPPPESYKKFQEELTHAFGAFGFHGLPDRPMVHFKPGFPALKGASA